MNYLTRMGFLAGAFDVYKRLFLITAFYGASDIIHSASICSESKTLLSAWFESEERDDELSEAHGVPGGEF